MFYILAESPFAESLRGPATQHLHKVYGVFTYLYTYILKNCNQDPYGFKNLISSWGSWSKISKLQQVGDVSFFRSKSSLFIFTTTWESFFCECKENGANEPVYLQCTFGVQRLSIYTTTREAPSFVSICQGVLKYVEMTNEYIH